MPQTPEKAPPGKRRRRPRKRPKDVEGEKKTTEGRSTEDSTQGRKRRGRRRGPKRGADSDTRQARGRGRATETKPPPNTLSPREVEEYKAHFAFLSRYRKLLRLKPNATEDLLLNGTRDPSHRGVCKHLLAKVDNASVQSALSRLPDEDAKQRFLHGAVSVTGDPGVVVLYLESLGETDREEAAKACSQGLKQLDFTEVSAAQMRRMLELVAKIFEGPARTRLIFTLLAEKSFRHVFEAAAADLPADLVDTFGPLSAIHRRVFERSERGRATNPEDLDRGITLLLDTKPHLNETATHNLIRCITESRPANTENAVAVSTMLQDAKSTSRDFSTLVMDVVRWLIGGEQEDASKALLKQVGETHPTFELPKRWLQALNGHRAGEFALVEEGADGYQRALWTRGMRPCWVWLGAAEEAEAMTAQVQLQESLVVPSVAPLLGHGIDTEGRPYLAQALLGRWVRGAPKDGETARTWARDGIALIAALAARNLTLPDIRSRRFVADTHARLFLTDLQGLRETPTPEHTLALALDWAQFCLRRPVSGKTCEELIQRLETLP